MRFYPKGFLALSVAAFIAALALFSLSLPPEESPPAVAQRPTERSAEARSPERSQDAFPSIEALSLPWYRRPPHAPAPPRKAVPPAQARSRVDASSLVYLGSSTESDGASSYFFKFVASGQVIILKPGQAAKGWKLDSLDGRAFHLSSSGGEYEVSR
jgi:hypothetical protein